MKSRQTSSNRQTQHSTAFDMFNIPKRKIAVITIIIVILEVVVLRTFFGKKSSSKKVKAYRLLSGKDLEKHSPDIFLKVFPQFRDNGTTLMNTDEENITSVIHPSFAKPEMFVLFLVTSVPDNFQRRQLIRTTWANTWRGSKKNGKAAQSLYTRREWPKLRSNCVFVVGISAKEKFNLRIVQEASVLGDIFRPEVDEGYANVVDKVWKAFEWSISVNTKYVFKVEDGVYVNIPRMVHWLQTDRNLPKELYAGYVVFRHPIQEGEFDEQGDANADGIIDNNRTIADKLDLSKYCLGSFYIFSSNVLPRLVRKAKDTNKVQAGEDAYTGLVAQNAYLRPYSVANDLFVLDGSHGAYAIELKEEKLKHTVCLGDKFNDDFMTQMHERYVYIRKRIDGKV